MRNKFSKSNSSIKSLLFLSLGLLFSMTVKSQCPIIDSAIVTDVSCYNGADGSIDLAPLNTGGLYSYAFSNGQTGLISVINNLNAGTYTVIITDLVDPTCTQDTSFEITQPQDPLSIVVNLDLNIKCYGDSTGVATAQSAIGGTFPYTYVWDNGQNTLEADSLWEGMHVITATDFNGCIVKDSIYIEYSNDSIEGIVNILNQVSCFGSCDANVELSSVGGISPYIYDWGTFLPGYNGNGPDTVFNLCYGAHNVLIEDAIGCRRTISFSIDQPDELFAIAIGNGAPIPGQLSTQPVQCFGFDDGTAYASATQGTLGYTFVWDSINGPTGQYIDSLAPGIHTVYVTDTNGCTASDTVLITEPTKLVVEIDSSLAVYAYCSNTNSGELCATASGGTPNYVYTWNTIPLQNTPCVYDLQPDQYTILVVDDRQCTAIASFDLDSVTNSFNADSVVIIEDSVSCFGLYDGALTATNIIGGVFPYTYDWVGPNFYNGTGSSISSLYFGSYGLDITDVNGCKVIIGIFLNEPDELEYDIYNTVDETCLGADNGQIWVHVNGGTSPYYYDSSQSNLFPIPNGNQVLINNDSVMSNLLPGTYSIYITDENNCEGAIITGGGTAAFQAEINTLFIVPIPEEDVTNNTTSCYNIDDGAAEVDSAFLAENPLLTYTWEEDIAGIPSGTDISNGAGSSWGSFAPGTYWLVAHYADSASFEIPYSSCDNQVSFIISSAPAEVNVVSLIEDVSCYSYNDGEIDLTVTGGNGPPFVYQWDTTSVLPLGGTTNLIDSLIVGNYAVSISDANGCISISAYEVTEPAPLISDITPTPVSCFGFFDGEATVNTVGGSLIQTYLWSDTLPAPNLADTLPQTGATADSLLAGTYTVTVIDVQGCSYTDTVEILEPADPIISIEVESSYSGDDHVRCFGDSNGAALATGSGVSFMWFEYNDSTTFDTVFGIPYPGQYTDAILGEGEYIVISKDVNGCVDTSEIFEITEPDLLKISSLIESNPRNNGSPYHISCFGDNDGWAKVIIEGGYVIPGAGYTISWMKEDSVGTLTNGPIGLDSISLLSPDYSYIVKVYDANGCFITDTTGFYTQPFKFIANVTTMNYAGPFHGPKNISFIDSTNSLESYKLDWIWQDLSFSTDSNVISSNHLVVTHEFLEDELDTNYVFVMLTNEITGCQDSVEFIIEVQGIPDVYNVFTPNQDGINDEFSFSEYAMELVDVQIFNRWGQLVYTWVGADKSWMGIGIDGKDLPEGVYFYVFEGKGVDGHHYDKKGSVTLLR